MCGIAGIVELIIEESPIREVLEEMACALVHRGPDGGGVHIDGAVGFVHRRLIILDPNAGNQPMVDSANNLVLVFNGEIYNYIELRNELANQHFFESDSDTEVLLKAYATWGLGCLERLRGMFAFAIYDKNLNKVLIARDRLGIKPLYYSHIKGERFCFASELSALLPAMDNIEVDPSAIADYLRWQYVPTPKSIYKNIYKLDAGHYIEFNIENFTKSISRYWIIPEHNYTEKNDNEWLELLNYELDDAVRLHLRSDVPFGAFLSGGVDSSLVSAIVAKQLKEPLRTFSIGFKEESHSELRFARRAAEIIRSQHVEAVLRSEVVENIIESVAHRFGEPFADSSAIPTFLVSQIASESVKMVLSGDGGDELFAGYRSYENTFKDHQGQSPPSQLIRLAKFASTRLSTGRIQERLNYFGSSPLDRHLDQRQIFSPKELVDLLHENSDTDWPVRKVLSIIPNEYNDVSRFQYLDSQTYMLDDILTKVDRMSMANSLEVRVPLLDHKIVELAFEMPLSVKMRIVDGKIRSKHILKLSAERFYSQEFLNRPKMGFGIPILEWCSQDLKEYICDRFSNKQSRIYDFLNRDITQNIINEFYLGQTKLVNKVWALLILDVWLDKAYQKPSKGR